MEKIGELSRPTHNDPHAPEVSSEMLTIGQLEEIYQKTLDEQPPQFWYFDGWLINWKFPFIHRLKKFFPIMEKKPADNLIPDVSV